MQKQPKSTANSGLSKPRSRQDNTFEYFSTTFSRLGFGVHNSHILQPFRRSVNQQITREAIQLVPKIEINDHNLSNMTKPNHIAAFQSVKESLANIRKELKPFVRKLDSDNPEEKAQAQSVVALSIGTLRYMGARLRGKDQGRAADDPLRQELDQMRKVLVALEKKRKAREEASPKKEVKGETAEKATSDREGPGTTGSATKRQRRSL